jgi:fructan beta-fructosidase
MADTSDYRPELHFAPSSNWINDPNGMVFKDGTYHLFFQHNPASMVHGPMHWGHASSTDLVHWREQPIALYPTADGECFSGSGVAASEGHVADGLEDKVLLYFTAHKRRPDGSDDQVQHLALADASFTRFERHPDNPVLPNTMGYGAFRDPKVIWHAETHRWVMVVTHGQEIGFYTSEDGVRWVDASTFGTDQGYHSKGPWECPDLFPLTFRGDTLWVLVVGIGGGTERGGSATQYFVGTFDGVTFTNVYPAETVLWMDDGADFYATQSFSGPTDGRLALSWMSNWAYAQKTPNEGFRGAMTLARRVTLVEGRDGPVLAQDVPTAITAAFPKSTLAAGTNAVPGAVWHARLPIDLAPGTHRTIALFGETLPHFILRNDNGTLKLRQFRSETVANGGALAGFARDVEVPLHDTGPAVIELYVDHGMVELLTDQGRMSVSNLFFPADVAGPVTIG